MKYSPTTEEALANTKNMLAMNLVTHQTGAEGQEVLKVYITEEVGLLELELEICLNLITGALLLQQEIG